MSPIYIELLYNMYLGVLVIVCLKLGRHKHINGVFRIYNSYANIIIHILYHIIISPVIKFASLNDLTHEEYSQMTNKTFL